MTHIIAPIINFSFVAIVLYKYAKKPICEFFSQRSATVLREVDEGKALAAEAVKEREHWEFKWNTREEEIGRFQQDAVEVVAKAREKGVAHSKAESQRILKEAEQTAQTEAVQSKSNLSRNLIEESIREARAFLTNNLEDKDKRRLVADYLELVQDGKGK